LGWVVGDAGLTHDNTLAAPACPLKPPTPSPLTTPPGSRAPAATEIPPRHRALTLVAFVAGTTWPQASVAEPLAQAHERFGGGGGGGGALAFPVKQRGAEGQVAVAGGGGEEGFAFFSGCRTAGCNGWVRARARLRGGTSSAQSRGWRR
jgi:hypothetical protein